MIPWRIINKITKKGTRCALCLYVNDSLYIKRIEPSAVKSKNSSTSFGKNKKETLKISFSETFEAI